MANYCFYYPPLLLLLLLCSCHLMEKTNVDSVKIFAPPQVALKEISKDLSLCSKMTYYQVILSPLRWREPPHEDLKKLLFFLENQMDQRGYQRAEKEKQPDFYLSLDMKQDRKNQRSNLLEVEIVAIASLRTMQELWMAKSTQNVPKNVHPLISSQKLIQSILDKIPPKENNLSLLSDSLQETLGAKFDVQSCDGRNFYPILIGLQEGSLMQQAHFQKYDSITHLNGKSTENMSLKTFYEEFADHRNDTMKIKVARSGNVKDLTIPKSCHHTPM